MHATEGKWSQVGTYVACAAGADLLFKGVKYGCKMLKSYGKNLIEDVAKKIGIKCLKESAKEIAEHTTINVVRSYADEVAEKSVKELAENNSEHAAREVAEDVARKSASEAAENASEKEILKCCNEINCFTAGTLIMTADGYKPIEQIAAGDYVYAENPETGEKGLKQVVQTFENENDELVEVYIDDEIIETTTGHPFWVEGKGWTDAKDLQAGDQVRLKTSKTATIDKVEIIFPKEGVKVYNFEVEDWHTYYVSEMGVLVHNMCGGKGASKAKSSKRLAAEAKLEKAAKGDIGPTIDRATGCEVGTIYVDANGNAMISPKGGGFTSGGYRGLDTQTTYPNGSAYQRNNPNGHINSPGVNHGHGHLQGTGPGKNGTGSSIDINGNIVSRNSPAAHWPTY